MRAIYNIKTFLYFFLYHNRKSKHVKYSSRGTNHIDRWNDIYDNLTPYFDENRMNNNLLMKEQTWNSSKHNNLYWSMILFATGGIGSNDFLFLGADERTECSP